MRRCENCGAEHILGTSEKYTYCPKGCKDFELLYQPMPHQRAFHEDRTRVRLFAGGFGSGKTRTCVMEIIRHAIENPRGRTLMMAPTLQLLEQTSKKELYDNLPPTLIKHEDKKNSVLTLWNDHEILFRSADDEGVCPR